MTEDWILLYMIKYWCWVAELDKGTKLSNSRFSKHQSLVLAKKTKTPKAQSIPIIKETGTNNKELVTISALTHQVTSNMCCRQILHYSSYPTLSFSQNDSKKLYTSMPNRSSLSSIIHLYMILPTNCISIWTERWKIFFQKY